MPHKPKPKQDDPEEYKRFLEAAKKVEAEKDAEAFERAFAKVIQSKRVKASIPT